MSIVAREGDITQTHATVVVNAGNTSLWLGSGVAGAIRTSGGPEIQKELDRITKMREHFPRRFNGGVCELAEVIITHAGKMNARYVFHAAVMDCKGSLRGYTDLDIVRMATVNCMLAVRQYAIRGISFPLFGTGVGGLGIEESARTIIQAIKDYNVSDILARVYAYDPKDFKVLKAVLEEMCPLYDSSWPRGSR